MIKVSGICKSFRDNEVLKDISFEINRGEIVVLLGPSGAGKTTILRCINGLEACDRGSIEIDGEKLCKEENGRARYASAKELRNLNQKIGMVFQNYNLFPHMTVLENIIEAPMSVYGISKSQAENNARELLKAMGIADKIDSYPYELSGGQKQRVAIARACAQNPKIICFDEPTSALDHELRESVAGVIEELALRDMGVLIITHDLYFAERIADRIIYMDNGEIVKEVRKTKFVNGIH